MSLEYMKVHVRPEWRIVSNTSQCLYGGYCAPGRYHSAYRKTIVSLEHSTVSVWRLLCLWKISQCLQEDYSVLGTCHSACMEAIVPMEDITVPTGRL